MRPWSLTTALAAVEPDVWSTTPFAAIGTVRPLDDGRVRFEMRTPLAAAVSVVGLTDLPAALQPSHAAGVSVARLSDGRDQERAVDRLAAAFALD